MSRELADTAHVEAEVEESSPAAPDPTNQNRENPHMNTTTAWALPARALADYVTQTSRLPRQSGADNDVEIKAGNILRRFRRMLSQNEMDADLRAWLDQNIPAWSSENTRPAARGMRGQRTFPGQARRIAHFYRRTGRMPSSTSPVQRERELGIFLVNHRQAAKGKGTTSWSDSKRQHLDRVIPGWERRGGAPAAKYHQTLAVGL